MEPSETLQGLLDRATTLIEQGEVDEALSLYAHTLELDPSQLFSHLHELDRLAETQHLLTETLARKPHEPHLIKLRAFFYFYEGLQEEALVFFERTLSLVPDDETALGWRVISLLRLKRVEEARQALEEALRLLPQSTHLLNKLGFLQGDPQQYAQGLAAFEREFYDESTLTKRITKLRKLKRFEEARQALEEALRLFPQSTRLLLERGFLLDDQRQHEKALAAFDQVLSLSPKNEIALIRRATALRKLRRFEDARKALDQALRRRPRSTRLLKELGFLHDDQRQHAQALTVFERVLSLAPTDEAALSRRATALRRLKRFDDARKALEESLRLRPQSSLLLNELGFLYNDQRQYTVGLAAFERLCSLDSPNELVHRWRVAFLRRLRRFEEARKVLDEALRQFPLSPLLQNEIGFLLDNQGLYEKALAAFEKTLSFAPNEELAHKWRVISLRQLTRFTEARGALEAALKLHPHSVVLMNERGNIEYDQQRFEAAHAAFESVTRFDPANTYAQYMRAVCLRRLRKYDEAAQAIDAALTHVMQRTALLHERGALLDDTGRFAEAEAAFAEAMTEDPNSLDPIFARAEVLVRLGRSSDALELIQAVERNYPDDPNAMSSIGWFYLQRNHPLKARRKFEELPSGDELREQGLGGVNLALRNYADAEAHFERALRIDPWSAVNHTNVAWALMRQEDAASLLRAEMHCRRALDIDREYPKALGCLGVIAFRRGHFRESEDWLLASIRVSPIQGSYSDLGALYVQTGRHAEAKKHLERAIALDANDVRAWIELGNLHWQLEEKKEAFQALRRAVAIDPDSDEPYRALALVLMLTGGLTEAENILRQGLRRLDPAKQWRLHLTLAQVIRAIADRGTDRKLYEEAHQALRLSLRQKDELESHFELGLILAKLEDYEGALFEFEKCLRFDEHHAEARRNTVRLRVVIRERRIQTRGSAFGTWFLGIGSIAQIIGVWTLYLRGELDAKTLVIFVPILIGISAVGVLLPWLTRLKLPGIEAELSQAKPSISAGPTGDIGLTSPMPSITRGPH